MLILMLTLVIRDTLTVSAWNLLELIKDISRARTFFLALTLRRTESSNPRTLYSLVEAEVLPLSALEAVFASLGNFADSSPVSPKSLLARDEEQRKREGGLGSVMVMSIELPKGDSRKPHDAMKEVRKRFANVCASKYSIFTIAVGRSHPSTFGPLQSTQEQPFSVGE